VLDGHELEDEYFISRILGHPARVEQVFVAVGADRVLSLKVKRLRTLELVGLT
jgi:hypothetical protein